MALSKLFDLPASNVLSEQEKSQEEDAGLRLQEVVPSLIASYKLNIVQQSLNDIIETMKRSDVKGDKERYRKLIAEFSEKSKLAKELAKECGERVVLK